MIVEVDCGGTSGSVHVLVVEESEPIFLFNTKDSSGDWSLRFFIAVKKLKGEMSFCFYRVLRQRFFTSPSLCRFVFHGAGIKKPDGVWQKICGRAISTRSRSNIMRDKTKAIRTNVLEVIYGGRDKVPEGIAWKQSYVPSKESSSDDEELASGGIKGSEIKHRAFLRESKEYERSSLDYIHTFSAESVSTDEKHAHHFLKSLKEDKCERILQSDAAKNIACLCKLSNKQRITMMTSSPTEYLGEYLCRAMPDMKTDAFVQSLLIFYWWELSLSAKQNTLIEKECLQRMSSWDVDTLLLVTDWWICMAGASSWTFHKEMLSLLRTSWTTLSAQQMVQAFYLCGQFKRPAQELMNKLVLLAEHFVDELSLTEIATICNGMIKSAGRLPHNSILPSVISAALSKDIPLQTILEKYNVVTIMRFLGRSYHYDANLYCKLAKDLVPHIPEMSHLSLPHIAGVYARAAYLSEPLFSEVLRCFDHSKANLKDYYLMLWSFCRLNYTPEEFSSFVEAAVARITEKEEWTDDGAFLFVKTLVPLSFIGKYPVELLCRVFSPAYLNKYAGRCPPDVYKHLYCLDCSVAIECPDYNGLRLPKDIASLSKVVPHGSSKVIGNEKQAYAGIISTLTRVLESKDAFLVHPILDHIRTPVDIEVHLDLNNQPITLQKIRNMTEMPSTKLAVLVGPENHYRKDSTELLGVHVMKRRQLKIAGYHIVEIPFHEWDHVRTQSAEKRKTYLTSKIFDR